MCGFTYLAACAQDAQRMNYGGPSYWAYLDKASKEGRDYFLRNGDPERAQEQMTRSLSDALRGNDGD